MIWNLLGKARATGRYRRFTPEKLKFRPAFEYLEAREMLATTPAMFVLNTPSFTNGSTNTNWLNVSGNLIAGSTTVSIPPQVGTATLINSSMKTPLTGAIVATFDPTGGVTTGLAGINFTDATNTNLDASIYSSARTAALPFSGAATPMAPTIGGGTIPAPGSAPHDLGNLLTTTVIIFTVTLGRAAIRNFVVTTTTPSAFALTGVGPTYTFSSKTTVTTKSGDLDYNISLNLLGNTLTALGETSLAGSSATNFGTATPTGAQLGTLTNLGNAAGQWTMRLPVSTVIQEPSDTNGDGTIDSTINLTITGTMVGTWTPPGKVTGVEVEGGALQRSKLTTLKVSFDRNMALNGGVPPASAFSLTGPGGAVGISVVSALEGGVTKSTITFNTSGAPGTVVLPSGALALNGAYTLAVAGTNTPISPLSPAGGINTAGNNIDGDNDGLPGGTFTFGFTRKYADLLGNGDVNLVTTVHLISFPTIAFGGQAGLALNALNAQLAPPLLGNGGGVYDPLLDNNGDGIINNLDLAALSIDSYSTVLVYP